MEDVGRKMFGRMVEEMMSDLFVYVVKGYAVKALRPRWHVPVGTMMH